MSIYDVYFERLSRKLKLVYSSHGFGFDAFQDSDEARDFVLSNIAEDAIITFGGSQSINQIGLIDAIKNGNYKNFINRDLDNLKYSAEIAAFTADVYLCSANAITSDGIIVNIDGTGNRVAATIYGPKKVYLIVGKNKLATNEREAINRAKNVAAAYNSIRFNLDNPCANNMECDDSCTLGSKLCSFTVSISKSIPDSRIHIVFINRELGF